MPDFMVTLSHQDRVRVEYSHRRGVLVDLMVQLECLIGDEWRPARRYDTHLGLHVHTAPWDAEIDRKVNLGTMGLEVAFNRAMDDVQGNWERYRAACTGE